MVQSHFILALEPLHIRGGCSLIVLVSFLMLMGTRFFIQSASLCVVRSTYGASYRHGDSQTRGFL